MQSESLRLAKARIKSKRFLSSLQGIEKPVVLDNITEWSKEINAKLRGRAGIDDTPNMSWRHPAHVQQIINAVSRDLHTDISYLIPLETPFGVNFSIVDPIFFLSSYFERHGYDLTLFEIDTRRLFEIQDREYEIMLFALS